MVAGPRVTGNFFFPSAYRPTTTLRSPPCTTLHGRARAVQPALLHRACRIQPPRLPHAVQSPHGSHKHHSIQNKSPGARSKSIELSCEIREKRGWNPDRGGLAAPLGGGYLDGVPRACGVGMAMWDAAVRRGAQ